MSMLVIWSIPTLLWLLVHRFSPGAVGVTGLFWPRWRWLAAGVVVGALSLGLGWAALSLIPASSLDHPDVTGPIVSVIGGLSAAAAASPCGGRRSPSLSPTSCSCLSTSTCTPS